MDKERIRRRGADLEPHPTHTIPRGSLSLPVKAVLFDIYGTLFISGSGDIGTMDAGLRPEQSLTALLRDFKLTMSPEELTKQLHNAIRMSHAASRRQGVTWPEVDIEKIWADILPPQRSERIREFAIRYEMSVNPVAPMPGLRLLLAACRSRSLEMGLVSNAQFYTPLLFEWFLDAKPEELGFFSDLCLYSYRMGNAKPSPSLFQKAEEVLKKKGLSAKETIYMGNDMRNDIFPADQIGFQTVLFAGDGRSLRLREDDPHCSAVKPGLVITHLQQLADMLVHERSTIVETE